jgi:hypothetical protein
MRRRIVLVAAILALAGCEQLVEDVRFDGAYVIEQVNSRVLPAVLFDDPGGWRVTVLSGRIVIDNGKYTSEMTTQREVGGEKSIVETSDRGDVRHENGTLHLVSNSAGETSSLEILSHSQLREKLELVAATILYVRE